MKGNKRDGRCYTRSGAHEFSYFLGKHGVHVTASCDRCGATHRFPVKGSLISEMPLDDMSAEEIIARFEGR